jgi:hypothetical protein
MADIAKVKRNIQRMIDQGAPESDIDAYVASEGTTPEELRAGAASQGTDRGIFGKVDDAVRMFATGATFGFGDKLAAGVDSMLGQGDYASNLEENRAMTEGANERLGYMGPVMEIGGSILPVAKAAQIGATATRLPGAIGKLGGMALDGTAFGALQAAGHDTDLGIGAATGAAFGAAGQGVGSLLGKALAKAKKVLTPEQLKQAASAAYQKADDAGVIFTPEAVNRLRADVYNDFANFGFHPQNQPGAKVAYDELTRLAEGGNVSLKGMDTARKVASGGFNPTNPSNNALIGKLTEKIDDFTTNAGPNDILAGDVDAGTAALKQARDLWGRSRKGELVDELLAKAGLRASSTGSGGNLENASRQNLRKILDSKKMKRGFTADERAALKKAVMGSKTQNALRLAGKLSPQGNGLMLGLMGAGSIAAPHIAIPAALGGFAAKKGAEAITKSNVSQLQKLIAAGGNKSALKKTLSPEKQKAIDALIRALMITGTTSALPAN